MPKQRSKVQRDIIRYLKQFPKSKREEHGGVVFMSKWRPESDGGSTYDIVLGHRIRSWPEHIPNTKANREFMRIMAAIVPFVRGGDDEESSDKGIEKARKKVRRVKRIR